MSGGLFVWAGGRWRALDACSGRVAGWPRPARFVYRARGHLRLASSAAVLRALRAFLAGQRSAVHDGPAVPRRRRKRRSQASCSACLRRQPRCAQQDGYTNNNNKEGPQLPDVATHALPTADTGVQVTLSPRRVPPERPKPSPRPPKCRTKRKRSASPEPHFVKQQVLAQVHRSSSEECLPNKPSPSGDEGSRRDAHFKELIINERDVDLYRSYLIKHDASFDCYRFDVDENYKLSVFFRINPLVNLERSPQIERMLRGSQSSQMSLKDFATKLGLRSISDQESMDNRRYRMRRGRGHQRGEEQITSAEDTDKENQEEFKTGGNIMNRAVKGKKVLEERIVKESGNRADKGLSQPKTKKYKVTELIKKRINADESLIIDNTKEKDANRKERRNQVNKEVLAQPMTKTKSVSDQHNKKRVNADASLIMEGAKERQEVKPVDANHVSDSDRELQQKRGRAGPAPAAGGAKKLSAAPRPAKAKRPPGAASQAANAYSSLEDQAIVAWVSTGPRARLVNGNRLWRELQPLYPRLTGRRRTWHSLRNRYLRYILPALGALALPAPAAARLRAAAAAGELKSSSRAAQRHPMFSHPRVRSAFAARPRAPHTSDSEAPQESRNKSPADSKSNKSPDKADRVNSDGRERSKNGRFLPRGRASKRANDVSNEKDSRAASATRHQHKHKPEPASRSQSVVSDKSRFRDRPADNRDALGRRTLRLRKSGNQADDESQGSRDRVRDRSENSRKSLRERSPVRRKSRNPSADRGSNRGSRQRKKSGDRSDGESRDRIRSRSQSHRVDGDEKSRERRQKVRRSRSADLSDRRQSRQRKPHTTRQSRSRRVNKQSRRKGRRESRSESVSSDSSRSRDRASGSYSQSINSWDSSQYDHSSDDFEEDAQERRKSLRERRGSLKNRKSRHKSDQSQEEGGSRGRSEDRRKSQDAQRTPTYDQLTRQFTTRLRSTPNVLRGDLVATKSPTKEKKSQPSRMRKLFNPNAQSAILRRQQ